MEEKMKKGFKLLGVTLLAILMLIGITGCGKKEEKVEGTLDEIMDKLYEGLDPDATPMTEKIEITKDNAANYLGTDEIEYKEAMAREPLIGSIAHSVVLVRTKENADVEEVKKQIKENINPRKWVCVWVEDEDVIIKNKGDLIIAILIEAKDLRENISKNFDNL